MNNMNVPEPAKPYRHEEHAYVLMTAAYNEEANIQRTIEAVLAQTQLPKRWVIVSDGSIDKTDEIVRDYAKQHEFIRFLRVDRAPGRSFRSKVIALQNGSKLLEDADFDFIGNLDADVTVGSSYFSDLIDMFSKCPGLGLAGGFVCEETDGVFRSRKINRVYSVAHAAQLLRRECYADIGGYAVLEYGGEDWHAQTTARMKGWKVQAFPELEIHHLRQTGTGDNLLRHKFRQGKMDHSFGCDPVFEILKCLGHLSEPPLFTGGAARLIGFLSSSIGGAKRPVSDEFVAYLRAEQRQKISSAFSRVWGRVIRRDPIRLGGEIE